MSTNPTPGAVRSGAHPAIIVAAVAVTAFAVVGTAALMGWLPSASSVTTPASVAMPSQQVSGGVASEYSVPELPAEPAPKAEPTAPEVRTSQTKTAAKPAPSPVPEVGSSQTKTASKPQAQPSTPVYRESAPSPPVVASSPASSPAPAPAKPACTNCGTVTSVSAIEQPGEGSGLGAVLGGVVGGVLGHQVGGGRGKDVATVAGAVGGAYAGHQIEKGQKKAVTWDVRVKLEDGTDRTVKFTTEPAFRVGDKVRLESGKLVRG
jgi:outer membrane lipoprotein SlyB